MIRRYYQYQETKNSGTGLYHTKCHANNIYNFLDLFLTPNQSEVQMAYFRREVGKLVNNVPEKEATL